MCFSTWQQQRNSVGQGRATGRCPPWDSQGRTNLAFQGLGVCVQSSHGLVQQAEPTVGVRLHDLGQSGPLAFRQELPEHAARASASLPSSSDRAGDATENIQHLGAAPTGSLLLASTGRESSSQPCTGHRHTRQFFWDSLTNQSRLSFHKATDFLPGAVMNPQSPKPFTTPIPRHRP